MGRNAQLFAVAIAELDSPERRYAYLRILVHLVETAHAEWGQSPQRDTQISELAVQLSGGRLELEEVAAVVRVRDEERGMGSTGGGG